MPDASALFEALDANAAVHLGWLAARTPGMTVEDDAEWCLIDTGLPSARLNFVARARLSVAVVDRSIRRAIDRFADRGAPFAWWVTPASRPVDVGIRLVSAGLRMAESFLCMEADLDQAAHAWTERPGDEVQIVHARTADQFRDVGRVIASLAPAGDPHVAAYYELVAPAAQHPTCPVHPFVAYVQGQPVATAECTLAEGVAGIYSVAVDPAWRRHGYGAAVTTAALRHALDAGFRTAVLEGSALGENIYARLGFRGIGLLHEYQP